MKVEMVALSSRWAPKCDYTTYNETSDQLLRQNKQLLLMLILSWCTYRKSEGKEKSHLSIHLDI